MEKKKNDGEVSRKKLTPSETCIPRTINGCRLQNSIRTAFARA